MNRLLLSASLLLVALLPLEAQETTGDILGRVQDDAGRPLTAVTVTLRGEAAGWTRRATTSDDGSYRLRLLPPGVYSLVVQRIGFAPMRLDSVHVRLGATTAPPTVTLRPAAVALADNRVVAPSVSLDPERTTVGGQLDATELAGLPGARDHTALIATLPHANTSFFGDGPNVGGATGLENAFFVDGVNTTEPLKATQGISLPFNFVQSVQVRSGGFEAQYGRALGAVVNAVTHTGTNTVEWDAFAFATSAALTADSRALPTLGERDRVAHDAGLRVSGPVVRDHLWFSAAINPRRERAMRRIGSLGEFADTRTTNVFAGKLTWEPAATSRVELSMFGDPTERDGVDLPPFSEGLVPTTPDPYLFRDRSGGSAVVLRAHHTVGDALLFEASASQVGSRTDRVGRTDVGTNDETFRDRFLGTISGGVPWDRAQQLLTNVTMRATLSVGTHLVLAGAEMEELRVTRRFHSIGIGDIERSDDSTYALRSQGMAARFGNQIPTFYLQDAWRVTPNLTLSAGLRWSRQSLSGQSGRVAQRLSHEWQPRAGFSWAMGRERRARVFGSAGRYYQQQPLNLATLYFVDYEFVEMRSIGDPRVPGTTIDTVLNASSRESDFAGTADGASAEHSDEYTLGFERLVGTETVVTIRGIRRTLQGAFQQGVDASCPLFFCIGTPGEGTLAFLPEPRREYTAVELSLVGGRAPLRYRASYVFSRNYGNYVGLYSSDNALANPGNNYGYTTAAQAENSVGLLPNDRPHVFKVSGIWALNAALEIGAVASWSSGTPINKYAADSTLGAWVSGYLVPRGSAGRTPSVFDVSLRLAYVVQPQALGHVRIFVDANHLSNQQAPVRVDQQYNYVWSAGAPVVNPNYRKPLAFSPPASIRFGVQWTPVNPAGTSTGR